MEIKNLITTIKTFRFQELEFKKPFILASELGKDAPNVYIKYSEYDDENDNESENNSIGLNCDDDFFYNDTRVIPLNATLEVTISDRAEM